MILYLQNDRREGIISLAFFAVIVPFLLPLLYRKDLARSLQSLNLAMRWEEA